MRAIESLGSGNKPIASKGTPDSSFAYNPELQDTQIGKSPPHVTVRPAILKAPKSLVKDEKGDVHYFGENALISITSEAERFTEEAIKGSPMTQISEQGQTETFQALKGLSKMTSNVSSQILTEDGLVELRQVGKGWWLPEKREEAIRLCTVYFDGSNRVFPYFHRELFFERLSKWYDNPDEDDRGWLVCFNNVLLFGSHHLERRSKEPAEYKGLIEKFFSNVWIACDDISLFLSPRLANVQALMTTAIIAQEISRPGLCWVFMATACNLAQAIGLHRRSDPSQFRSSQEYEERKWVFWNLYLLDKTLSLQFGRCVCLPDFDIDVEYPLATKSDAHWFLFTCWLWLSKIKGKIYTKLYSASAAQQSDEERQTCVTELDQELKLWWEEKASVLLNQEFPGVWEKIAVEMQMVLNYHNTMIMIHRVNRGEGHESERLCLESARESLKLAENAINSPASYRERRLILW
jgi:hypothetical protein